MDKKFNVVCTGLQEGIAIEDFTAKFCEKFGVSEQKAQKIVNSGSDVVVKKEQDEKKAAQYQKAFESCGMVIRLDELSAEPETSSGLSLEPIEKHDPENQTPSTCPKCGSDNIEGDKCLSCGIFISKYQESQNNIVVTHTDKAPEESNNTLEKKNNIEHPVQTEVANSLSKANNPYATPEASLERNTVTKEGQGSLEGGIDGDYDFSIGDIFSEAWQRTGGVKATFLGAWGIYILIAMAISFITYFFQSNVAIILESLVKVPVLYPILAGITLMGVHHSVDAEINSSSVVGHYGKVIPISLMMILMTILGSVGMLLLIIPGIYLFISYTMALPLMMDRNLGIWESLETSRKAVTKHWFKIFAIYLLLLLLLMVAGVTFFGLIWALPMFTIAQGVMYKYIFGVESVE